MPYTINKSNGLLLTTVQDGTIDKTTSLTLVGRNYTGYGSPVDENFVYLLENFSNNTAPKNPITGQLWYNSANDSLSVYNGTSFKTLSFITVGNQKPLGAKQGDFFYDNTYLWIYNGTDWIIVGPQNSGSGGGLSTFIVNDETQNAHSVIEIPITGSVAAVISNDQFSVYTGEHIYSSYNTIYPGINLSGTNSAGISGYFTGNNYTAANQVGTLLWGTAASSLGLVDDSGPTPVIIRGNQFVTNTQLYSGLNALYISDNNGLTVGTPQILQLHSTGSNVANISVIHNNSPLNINLNTNAGTYTNVLQINNFNGLQIIPSGNSVVSLGSLTNYFGLLYVNTITSNLINTPTINANTVNATLASLSTINATTTNITGLLTTNQIQASGITSVNVTATTVRSTSIYGNQIYDSNARVLTTATLGSYGVISIQGTTNQISASAGAGSVTLSLANTVSVAVLTATNSIYAPAGQVFSGGLPCLTAATVPSAGVGTITGSANQVLEVDPTGTFLKFGNVTMFTESVTAPSNPNPGDRWLNSTTGILFTWYADDDSTQWVEFG